MTTFASWKSDVSDSFNNAADWSTGAVPGASTGVTLPTYGSAYTVKSTVNNTIYGIGVASGATLAVAAGVFSVLNYYANEGAITIAGGATLKLGTAGQWGGFGNSGVIDLNGGTTAATAAEILVATNGAGVVFNSGGTIALSNSAYNQIVGGTSSASATLKLDYGSITGAGVIGGAYLLFDSAVQGTVTASDSTALRIVGPIGTIAAGKATDENDGTIQTTGTGGLVINADMYNGGQILADGAGALWIGTGSKTAGSTVQGGGVIAAGTPGAQINLNDTTLESDFISTVAGTPTVAASAINSLAGTVNTIQSGNLDNAGSLVVAGGSTLNLNASVQNTGVFRLNGGTTAADLLIYGGGAELLSGGELVLSNSTNNLIGSAASAATKGTQFTNHDNTIQGAGTIGDANLRFVNLAAGKVYSIYSAGLTLFGNTNSNLVDDYNDGLIENTGAGTLTMENSWDNAGTIEQNSSTGALNLIDFNNTGGGGYFTDNVSGGIINLKNVNLAKSTLDTVVGSTVTITSGETSTIDDEIFNHGSLNINSATLIGDSNYYNYGTINLEGANAGSILELNGDLYLRGHGNLVMGDTFGNSIVTNGSAHTLNNSDNTISGFGTIGDANMTFDNNHNATVDANGTTALIINTGANQVYNAGLMESTGAGGLTIQGNLINQGTLAASAGTLDVTENVASFGAAQISKSGSIEFGGQDYQNATIEAGATGSLILDHSTSEYVPDDIFGFGTAAPNAKIDLRDIQDTSLIKPTFAYASNLSLGTLSVTDGTHTANVYFAGNYTGASFKLSMDGHGGTNVSFV